MPYLVFERVLHLTLTQGHLGRDWPMIASYVTVESESIAWNGVTVAGFESESGDHDLDPSPSPPYKGTEP